MTIEEWRGIREAIDHGVAAGAEPVVATLYDRSGHSYRDPGAMMAMTETLQIIGGVAGGCVEEYVGRAGRDMLRETAAAVMTLDADDDAPGRPAPGCGGTLHVVVERGGATLRRYLDAVIDATQASDRAVAVIRVSAQGGVHVSRGVVADGVTTFDGETAGSPPTISAGEARRRGEDEFRDLVDEALATRGVITRRSAGETLTASYLWPQPRLAIFGARDDAVPLVRMAKAAGWMVTVADRRARLATAARFGEADVCLDQSWPRAVAALDWKPWTAVVAMTHSFDDDLELLPLLSRLDVEYLGFLGPAVRTNRLLAANPQIDPARVRSPIGLPLGDKSAGGIAVAIMAELTTLRRRRERSAPTVGTRALP